MALRVATLGAGLEAGQAVGPARQAAPREAGLEPLPVADRDGLALLPGLARGPAAACPLRIEGGHLPGDVEVLVGGQAQQGFGKAISSAPSGSPCASLVSVRWGEGQPMWLRSTSSDGRSASAMARRSARLEGVQVVGNLPEALDVPAVALERFDDVVGARELGGTVDRDVVVVEDVHEAPEAEMAGERGGLVAHALHQVPVPADPEDVMVYRLRPK